MMNERDFVLLKMMRDEADKVLSAVSSATSASDHDRDLLDNALSFSMRRLGIKAEQVSHATRELAPDVRWKSLIQMSRDIIEQYDTFDVKNAWFIATNLVPTLRAELERVIAKATIEGIEADTALKVEWDSVRNRLGVSDSEIAEFCNKHAIRRLSLFGSVLRDDFHEESDIDVLIRFEPDKRLTIGDLIDAEIELSDLVNRKVDLVQTEHLNEHIRDNVIGSAQVLYERTCFE